MKHYKCLTQDEFENLEDGTEIEFLTVDYSNIIDNVFTHKWKWQKIFFFQKDLELAKPNYFQYGKYRIFVAETKYISVMDDMIDEITEVVTNKALSN